MQIRLGRKWVNSSKMCNNANEATAITFNKNQEGEEV